MAAAWIRRGFSRPGALHHDFGAGAGGCGGNRSDRLSALRSRTVRVASALAVLTLLLADSWTDVPAASTAAIMAPAAGMQAAAVVELPLGEVFSDIEADVPVEVSPSPRRQRVQRLRTGRISDSQAGVSAAGTNPIWPMLASRGPLLIRINRDADPGGEWIRYVQRTSAWSRCRPDRAIANSSSCCHAGMPLARRRASSDDSIGAGDGCAAAIASDGGRRSGNGLENGGAPAGRRRGSHRVGRAPRRPRGRHRRGIESTRIPGSGPDRNLDRRR